MGIFDKKPACVIINLLEGITDDRVIKAYRITYDDEYLIIGKSAGPLTTKVEKSYKIQAEKVISLDIITEKNIEEKSKSVVGRGIAGAVLFGPAGLLLGGMSGIGNKTKTKIKFLFCISYSDKENEVKNIIFDTGASVGFCEKVIKEFKKKHFKELESNENGDIML